MCFAHFPKTTAPQKVIVTASFLLSISSNGLTLKEHVALDWTSWSIKSYDSHKWPTVLVDEVKGKPRIFEACFCGSLYSTFTTPFYPYAKKKNGYKRLSKTNSTDPRQRVPLTSLSYKKYQEPFTSSTKGFQASSLTNGISLGFPAGLIHNRDPLGFPAG